MLKLYIGNKNYSSWSMRPWVLLKQAGVVFEEVLVRFDALDATSQFKRTMANVSPLGKVPVLVDDSLVIWDSLAIAEYVAEKFPQHQLWPTDARKRAVARSICAEIHSGFSGLRSHCTMNIEASLPDQGRLILRDQASVRADLARLITMWSELLAAHGGPMLFGAFSVADAYYAPVCARITTYQLPVPQAIADYVARVLALPGVKAWTDAALVEHDFVFFDEPYRLAGNA